MPKNLAIFIKVHGFSEGQNLIKDTTANIFCYETFIDSVGYRRFVKIIWAQDDLIST